MQEIYQQIQPVLVTALASAATAVLLAVKRWVESRLSNERHYRAASIVMDAMIAAAQALGPQWAAMMADGKLSDEERAKLKLLARNIAKERLSELRGLATARLGSWLEHQLDISLGKLEARINKEA